MRQIRRGCFRCYIIFIIIRGIKLWQTVRKMDQAAAGAAQVAADATRIRVAAPLDRARDRAAAQARARVGNNKNRGEL